MRPPQVGQQWVYQVRNVFNQELVDIVTETVVSLKPQIRIERTGQKFGRLPDEIQDSWGYVIQDPQWNPTQRFQEALPLWPEKLIPDWSGFYRTRYQIPNNPNASYYWGLVSKALQWERPSSNISMRILILRVMMYSESETIVKQMSGYPQKSGGGLFADPLVVTLRKVFFGQMRIGRTTLSGS
jgi:hypothetical protein